MGVYIKGMDMPKDCVVCPFGWNGCNKQHDFVYMGSRPDNCPLVPVPPHGRLIDADAVFDNLERTGWYDNADRDIAEDLVLAAPTIIEAEDGE